MSNADNKNINYSLNVAKCLAIFAVICIHCTLFKFGRKGLVIDALSRFAVPLFFLISGYFSFYPNLEKALDKYKTRSYRLIKLLISSVILYFVFYVFVIGYDSFYDALFSITLGHIFDVIIFNAYTYGPHLWFIGSLLYCYIFYYILGRFKFDYRKLYVLVPILLGSCLMLGEFASFMGFKHIPITYYRNFLFMALPFFTLGYFMHDNQEKLIGILSDKNLILIMVLSCLLVVIEVFAVGKLDLYVGSIIFAATLVLWCIKNPDKLNFKVAGFIGGTLYTSIYVLHLLVMKMLKMYGIKYGYFNPIIVFVVTSVISFLIYKVTLFIRQHRKKATVKADNEH